MTDSEPDQPYICSLCEDIYCRDCIMPDLDMMEGSGLLDDGAEPLSSETPKCVSGMASRSTRPPSTPFYYVDFEKSAKYCRCGRLTYWVIRYPSNRFCNYRVCWFCMPDEARAIIRRGAYRIGEGIKWG